MSNKAKVPTEHQRHRERLIKLRADSLEQKVKREANIVHETRQCVREQYQREMRIKKAFMALGREIATQLVGKGAIEMEAIMTEKCCEIMRELASIPNGKKLCCSDHGKK